MLVVLGNLVLEQNFGMESLKARQEGSLGILSLTLS